MNKNARRRLLLIISIFIICLVVILLVNIYDEKLVPSAYEYFIKNIPKEGEMPNAVTAIYLRYRIFDTLFETLLLAVAVSVVVYFASAWEKGKDENPDE